MDATAIIDVLSRVVPGDAARFEAAAAGDGMPTISVSLGALHDVSRALRDAAELGFVVLLDIVPVDYLPREPRYELGYLLLCPGSGGYGATPRRLRMKVRVPAGTPVPTVSDVWPAANWAEREAFDFYGIHFDGHPDLRRILMPEDWEGHPMRRDYPVQIRQAVKTYAPLQVSEEEFVANVEQARNRARND